MLQSQELSLQKRGHWVVFFATIIIGLIVGLYLFGTDKYSLLYFGDSASHSLGARKLVDWVEPGFQQLGTVWLPLPHLFLLPFTLVDPLFTSGFAGVAVSLPSLAITSAITYKMVRRHVGALTIVPLAAAMLYTTNPNVLYMGLTAMTEAPFMLFFVASAYYFQRWLENPSKVSRYMAYSAILVVAASLCRYEGWILPLFLIPTTIAIASRNKQMSSRSKAYAIAFSLISVSGILFWLGYNAIQYGNALEFANAQYYSAASQAANRPIRETLFLKPVNVLSVYGTTALIMYGPILLSMAAAGYAIQHRKKKSSTDPDKNYGANNQQEKMSGQSKLLYVYLALPGLFTLLTLLIGIGEMTFWFNSRFLILVAPLIILLSSVFIDRALKQYGSGQPTGKSTANSKKKEFLIQASVILAAMFFFQLTTPAFNAVVTFLDAKGGFDYGVNPYAVQAGEALRSLHNNDETIMMLTGSAQEHRIMLTSGIHLKQFDEIIESSTWKKSFYEPWKYDKWVVISKSPDSDGVKTTKYWSEEKKSDLEAHYTTVYKNQFYDIMILKDK